MSVIPGNPRICGKATEEFCSDASLQFSVQISSSPPLLNGGMDSGAASAIKGIIEMWEELKLVQLVVKIGIAEQVVNT